MNGREAGAGDSRRAELVTRLCRYIEASGRVPRLAELSAEAGLSPAHLHRLFRQATGVTPRAYAAAHRAGRLRAGLAGSGSVTEASYAAGYSSSGRLYADTSQRLGMTPTAFRRGGEGLSVRFAVGECGLGAVLVAATDRGVCAILLGDDAAALVADLEERFPAADLVGGDAGFEDLVARVVALVEDPARAPDLPLDIRGTAFQERVWQALRQIPAGTTATYAEIARRIGRPQAVRAVAGACAANPLAVAIPCHRVVRTDGSLSGYRWGIDRKRALLLREQRR